MPKSALWNGVNLHAIEIAVDQVEPVSRLIQNDIGRPKRRRHCAESRPITGKSKRQTRNESPSRRMQVRNYNP